MGPELMAQIRSQAERFGAELVSDDVVSVDLTGPVKVVRTHDARVHRRRGDPGDGLGVPEAGHRPARTSCPATACRGARPATASSSAITTSRSWAVATPRWRRPPSSPASRSRSRSCTVVTRCAPAGSWPTAPRANPKINWAWNSEVAGIHGDGAVTGSAAAGHRHRRGARPGRQRPVHRHRPRARAASWSAARSSWTTRATSSPASAPAPTSTACSLPAMSSITSTVKRSPPPGTGCQAALDAERYLAALADARGQARSDAADHRRAR